MSAYGWQPGSEYLTALSVMISKCRNMQLVGRHARRCLQTFNECAQLELSPSPNQGFTFLHRGGRIVKHAVDAVLPEHGEDDNPQDLPY